MWVVVGSGQEGIVEARAGRSCAVAVFTETPSRMTTGVGPHAAHRFTRQNPNRDRSDRRSASRAPVVLRNGLMSRASLTVRQSYVG